MSPPPQSDLLELADCTVDTRQQLLTRGDHVQHLTTRENEVLVYLWDNAGRTITREELLEKVWGHPRIASTEPVYSTIKRLRAKIETSSHRHIVTVHGDGYRFERPHTPPPIARAPPPLARTRFVGREAELTAITERLAAGARIITLVGPGGVGKTRIARELERRRTAPTLFVDLAEAHTVADALRALATALDVPLAGDDASTWTRGLTRALAATQALVVLDNVEQLVAELASTIADFAEVAPILATSREPLHLVGEHLIEMQPLPRDEAIALFIDRARMASSTFEPDVTTVAQIVERLDRLPLAIELAAARVKLLPPELLLDQLASQLDLRAPRDQTMRHATMRAAVDWSWRMLSEDERQVLAECAVFAGDFTLEAATAISDLDDVDALVERLVDRSLIRTNPTREGLRVELYAAVHEFADEQLALLPSADLVAKRHALWVLDECSRWVGDLDTRGHARARAHLERELDNLRRAFEVEVAAPGDPATSAALALVLDRVLQLRGGPIARRDVLTRALAREPVASDEAPLALALADCASELGDATALHWLDVAEAAAIEADLPDIRALTEATRATLAASHGDLAAALTGFEHAVARAGAAGARRVEGRTLTLLGEVTWRAGRAAIATDALERAAAIHRETGDLRYLARTNATLCHVARATGRGAQALMHLDLAERDFEALQDPLGRARTLIDRGLQLSRVGRQHDAIAALEEARRSFDRLGILRGQEEVQLNLAEALLGLGEDERALSELHHAVAICRELDERLRLPTALELLACAALLRQDIAAAEGALAEALAIAHASGNQRSESTVLSKRGFCHYLRSQWHEALADFEASAALNHARGESAMEGTSRADIAVALAALGRADEAYVESRRARALLGDPPNTSTWVTRMLTLLEAARDIHIARDRGQPMIEIRAQALTIRAAVLEQMPRESQDLATRLSCMLLEHALT